MTQDTPPETITLTDFSAPPPKRGIGARLRNWFFTGLLVAGPLAITFYITLWLINLIDGWVKPWIPASYNPDTYLSFAVPGVGLVVAFIGLTLLGFFTANLVGRTVVDLGENILNRMPFVRGLYKGVKQIFETVFKQGGSSLRKVALIEWPGPDLWSICFISEPARGPLAEKLPGEGYVTIFVPCTPNPTTGYLVMARADKVVEIDMTVDEGFKLLMSMGIIQPDARSGPPPVGPAASALLQSPQPSPRIRSRRKSSVPEG